MKVKRVLLSTIYFFFVGCLFAQNAEQQQNIVEETSNNLKESSFFIAVDAGFPWMFGKNIGKAFIDDGSFSFGYGFGLHVDYFFSEHWGVGLNGTYKKFKINEVKKIEESKKFGELKTLIDTTWLFYVGPEVKYRSNKQKIGQFYADFSCGYVQWSEIIDYQSSMFKSNVLSEIESLQDDLSLESLPEPYVLERVFEKKFFAVSGSLSYMFNVGEHFTIGPSFLLFLCVKNLEEDPLFEEFNIRNSNLSNFTVALNLGFKF